MVVAVLKRMACTIRLCPAPSGGDTTSQGQSEEQSGFPGGGEMPDFGGGMPGGMGGGMPGGGPMG